MGRRHFHALTKETKTQTQTTRKEIHTVMGLKVEYSSPASKTAPAGQYQAVCAELVDLGWSQKTYKTDAGQDEIKNVHEIQYIFQLNKVDEETGKRFTVRSRPFNLILTDRSNLRAFLLQWRGRDISDAEKVSGVEVDLVGHNALVQVVHNTVGDKTYANLGSLMPLMEGMPVIQVENYEEQKESILAAREKAAVARASAASASSTPLTHTGGAVSADTPHQQPPGHAANCQCEKCIVPF